MWVILYIICLYTITSSAKTFTEIVKVDAETLSIEEDF